MESVKISAVVITLNEELNLERCLNSLRGIADEIVVVDSFSTDRTEAIARSNGAKFIQHKFEGHIQQKNYAMRQATYDYVLSLDADEVLSDALRNSILSAKQNWTHDAFCFNRLTNYCGKWIKHCGWYPDTKTRLWNRRKGKWEGENPHDKVIMESGLRIKHLKGDLLHYSFPTIASHVRTANSFSEIAAKEAHRKGKKVTLIFHVILNPWFTFVKKYFFQLGFLDGYYGFIICRISALSNFLKYSKIRELNKHANPT